MHKYCKRCLPSGASCALPPDRPKAMGVRAPAATESWCFSRLVRPQWLEGRFSQGPTSIWVNLDAGAIQTEHAHINGNDVLALQRLSHRAQPPRFCPVIHAGIDSVPIVKPLRQSAPLAAIFKHVQHCTTRLSTACLLRAVSKQCATRSNWMAVNCIGRFGMTRVGGLKSEVQHLTE